MRRPIDVVVLNCCVTELRSDHDRLLPFTPSNIFPGTFTVPRSARSGTHPRVSSGVVHQVEVGTERGEPAIGGAAFLLHPDAQESLECGRNSISEKDVPPADDSQSRRGRSPD